MRPAVKKITDFLWEISREENPAMRVPARIYASKIILDEMDDGVYQQIVNVASLPGIRRHAICMPDGHWGYGFPIGGVAAFSSSDGVISPGGIGFDINCGMRLVRTDLTVEEVRPKIKDLVNGLFNAVPAGVGAKGFLRLSDRDLDDIMVEGSGWAVKKGYGIPGDLERTEELGKIQGADPEKVSAKAVERGLGQIGTLGSGNHYLEIQAVTAETVYDDGAAAAFGVDRPDQTLIMFHCGSRGFGHQIATDYLQVFERAMKKYGLSVKDRELSCAPFRSEEGQDYFKAMICAANAAFANRQIILHRVREVFSAVFKKSPDSLGMRTVYDVCHNIAKLETYEISGRQEELLVHRKGATRALGPGNPSLPEDIRPFGQPVIVGGSMETGSYLLAGTKEAERESFASTIHGSGRRMSRGEAKRKVRGEQIASEMKEKGIYVRGASMSGLAEEAGLAYKDLDEVVRTVHEAGLSKKVCRLSPMGNVKG